MQQVLFEARACIVKKELGPRVQTLRTHKDAQTLRTHKDAHGRTYQRVKWTWECAFLHANFMSGVCAFLIVLVSWRQRGYTEQLTFGVQKYLHSTDTWALLEIIIKKILPVTLLLKWAHDVHKSKSNGLKLTDDKIIGMSCFLLWCQGWGYLNSNNTACVPDGPVVLLGLLHGELPELFIHLPVEVVSQEEGPEPEECVHLLRLAHSRPFPL